jgi:hypothetical protein
MPALDSQSFIEGLECFMDQKVTAHTCYQPLWEKYWCYKQLVFIFWIQKHFFFGQNSFVDLSLWDLESLFLAPDQALSQAPSLVILVLVPPQSLSGTHTFHSPVPALYFPSMPLPAVVVSSVYLFCSFAPLRKLFSWVCSKGGSHFRLEGKSGPTQTGFHCEHRADMLPTPKGERDCLVFFLNISQRLWILAKRVNEWDLLRSSVISALRGSKKSKAILC